MRFGLSDVVRDASVLSSQFSVLSPQPFAITAALGIPALLLELYSEELAGYDPAAKPGVASRLRRHLSIAQQASRGGQGRPRPNRDPRRSSPRRNLG